MLKKAFAVAGAMVTGAALIIAGLTMAMVVPGAGTAASPTTSVHLARVDLSTAADVSAYLRSIGVDPRSLVIQRGRKNYAGPNCPGAGWTCTDARYVMQVGVQNFVECSLQECVIAQGPAAENIAKCIQKSTQVPFVRQRCSITQTGTFNEATIVQVAEQTGGATQAALQEVGLLQNATASTNRLQIEQEIKQITETGTVQDQDAYQVVGSPFTETTVPTGPAQQFAVAFGDNASQIVQKQIQKAKDGTMQKQNDGTLPADAGFDEPADCHEASVSVIDPNACVNLEQQAANGTNHQGQLSQSIDQEETTTVVGAVQRQNPAKFTGGTDGRVHQVITPGTSGTSQNQANQSETLRMFAPPGATQDQHGGASCCGFGSQVGGVGNSEQIQLQKDLKALGGTTQTATLVGTSSSPQGTCAVSNSAQTNSDESGESASAGPPCIALAVVTTCENAGGDGDPVVGQCEDSTVTACPPGTTPTVSDLDEDGVPNVTCTPIGPD